LFLNAANFNAKKRNQRPAKLYYQVNIVDHCNLNCVGCSAFSPLSKKSFLDINIYQRDTERIAMLGEVENVYLQGGEPLLHPDLLEFFEVTRKYIKNCGLSIVTNGVLLPKMTDSF
jgi:molybdenum cofactor biosynthesis enzyme MoaA